MRSPLHIALGGSAAGCLRAACRFHGMPGTVLGIPDDLSHGPLDNGWARIDYMRACFHGYDDWYIDVTDAFAPWRELVEGLDQEAPDAILIWGGGNVSEATFLAMACWWLKGRSEQVFAVTIPETDARRYVAIHTPAELADLFQSRRELPDAERADFAKDFARIRDATGLLRCWEKGRIIGVPLDRYDPLLLEACTTNWAPAPRVVGTAMGRCGERNSMSDLFFSSRLRVLIDAGRIEANGARDRLREYAVRLAGV